jgi:hypothetical protein
MKILRFLPSLIAIIALTAFSSIATADLVLFEFDFNTDGDTQGLIDFSGRLQTNSYDATNGVLVGTGGASNDPQLRTIGGLLAVDLGSLPDATLEIRMRNSTGGAVSGGLSHISFDGPNAGNTAGLPLSNFSFTPTAANTFEVFTVDAKAVLAAVGNAGSANDNVLRSLRLDPINDAPVAGDTFEIDYIRITTTAVPEPTSAAILGLASCGLLFRRRRA